MSIAEASLGLSAFLSFSTNIRSIQEGLATFYGHSKGGMMLLMASSAWSPVQENLALALDGGLKAGS